MILVRDVLQIDPARMKQVKATALENIGLLRKLNYPATRMMTDFVGDYYTLVIETEVPDLATFEKGLTTSFASPEWQAFYGKIRDAVRGGRREIYTLLG